MAKVKEILRLSDIWTVDMKQPTKHFALCIDNSDYEASLILGKVYRILRDTKAAKDDLVYRFIKIYLITRTELQTFSNDALLAPR